MPLGAVVVALGIATSLLVWAVLGRGVVIGTRFVFWSLVATAIAAFLAVLLRPPAFSLTGPRSLVYVQVAAILAAIVVAVVRPLPRPILAVSGLLIVVLFALLMVDVVGATPLDIDVYQLHEAAGEALSSGQNPYTTGNVEVWETLEAHEPELITEYTYPPLPAVVFGGASWLFGDSRVAGAVLTAIAMMFVGLAARRRWAAEGAAESLIAVAAFAAMPATFLMVYTGWTETLTLPLMISGAILWTEKPMLSAVAIGLAVASKQHFVLFLPLLALAPVSRRWHRAALASGVAALTYLPFVVWDPIGLYNGVVAHHLSRPARTESLTITNLGIEIPTVVTIVLLIAFGCVASRYVKNGERFLASAAAVLALFTFLAVRGFENSWWLVAMLLVACLALVNTDRDAALL